MPKPTFTVAAGEVFRYKKGFRHFKKALFSLIFVLWRCALASGGARNRSGPQKDPNSLTSTINGVSFTTLPADGYEDPAPDFPLPDISARESEVWESLWQTPQAAAWALEPWRWRVVAMYTRWSVRMEDMEANAALVGQVIRLGDQIGLTPAGLRENGWKIGAAEAARPAVGSATKPRSSSRTRLKVVGNDE